MLNGYKRHKSLNNVIFEIITPIPNGINANQEKGYKKIDVNNITCI